MIKKIIFEGSSGNRTRVSSTLRKNRTTELRSLFFFILFYYEKKINFLFFILPSSLIFFFSCFLSIQKRNSSIQALETHSTWVTYSLNLGHLFTHLGHLFTQLGSLIRSTWVTYSLTWVTIHFSSSFTLISNSFP